METVHKLHFREVKQIYQVPPKCALCLIALVRNTAVPITNYSFVRRLLDFVD